MEKRADWKETPTFNTAFNFKWHPISKGIKFDQLSDKQKQIVNHVECHSEITSKDGLFRNLSIYCELNKLNAFDYVPLTFIVDIDNATYNYDLERFITCYNIISNGCSLIGDGSDEAQIEKVRRGIDFNLSSLVTNKDRRIIRSCIPYLFNTHFRGKNLWIIKPTGLNRGRGVQVFSTLEEMKKIIKECSEGVASNNDIKPESKDSKETKEIKPLEISYEPLPPSIAWEASHPPISNLNSLPSIVKSRSFVIQKYIESPLLINKRKFDIRVWMLLTHEGKGYFFKEGYLRMSSYEYTTDTNNKEIHLTNNAIQKNTQKYGSLEDGNQLSFDGFQKYIDACHPESKVNVRSSLYQKMKEHVNLTLQCSRKKLNPFERKHCFEIFGYDFMIDSDFNTWLIEINTNPCLEESSSLLKMLIQRMLDTIFPKKKKKDNTETIIPAKVFSVDGYKDDENMWDYITQIGLIKTPANATNKIRRTDGMRSSIKEEIKAADDDMPTHQELNPERKEDETRVE